MSDHVSHSIECLGLYTYAWPNLVRVPKILIAHKYLQETSSFAAMFLSWVTVWVSIERLGLYTYAWPNPGQSVSIAQRAIIYHSHKHHTHTTGSPIMTNLTIGHGRYLLKHLWNASMNLHGSTVSWSITWPSGANCTQKQVAPHVNLNVLPIRDIYLNYIYPFSCIQERKKWSKNCWFDT